MPSVLASEQNHNQTNLRHLQNADLEKYDIQDKATMRGYHNKLITIAFINNDFKTALQEIEAGLKLTEKESDKYMWNIIEKNFIKTKLNSTIKCHLL